MKSALCLILVGWVASSRGYVVSWPRMEESPARVVLEGSRSPFETVLLKVEAFDTSFNLHLLPTSLPFSGAFRLQRAKRDQYGFQIFEDIDDDNLELRLYEDSNSGTVLRIENNTVEGLLTPTIALMVSSDGSHRAIRLYTNPHDNNTEDYKAIPGRITGDGTTTDFREIVSVTPEVYVIVDSTLTSLLGGSTGVKNYLSIFWNAVNQRYATVVDPQIKLQLAGALIIENPADEPFINSNVLQTNYIYGENTLNALGDWLYLKKDQLPKYDLAFLMTGKNMAEIMSGVLQDGVAGYAWMGAACTVSSQSQRSFNTGLGEDLSASFMGVMTAAHEVAHTLGAPHDGSNGAESCSWDDGYIMSYVSGKTNAMFFSPCSQKLMRNFLVTPNASCLKTNSVGSVIGLSPKLPGELITMDEQCKKLTGQSGAVISKNVTDTSLCLELVCQWQQQKGDKMYQYTMSSGQPAAEGSTCRSGGRCTNGVCK